MNREKIVHSFKIGADVWYSDQGWVDVEPMSSFEGTIDVTRRLEDLLPRNVSIKQMHPLYVVNKLVATYVEYSETTE